MLEEPFNHTRAFQQAIDTTITCRTLIRYNSNLNESQKEEILAQIESMLAFLSKRLETNASSEASSTLSPEKLADLFIYDGMGENLFPAEQPPATPREIYDISLQQIHKLYHFYLSDEPGKGIAAQEARYKQVMESFDELETLAELRHDATASDLTIESLLNRLRGFVSEQYYIFREFAALLSKVLEGQSIDVDTEAMVLLREPAEYPPEIAPQLVHDITPLVRIYNQQREFQQRRAPLYESVRDATAFLIFLQESLEQTIARRQEIVAQMKNTAGLLNELLTLLSDYEQAVAHLMQSPSKSR